MHACVSRWIPLAAASLALCARPAAALDAERRAKAEGMIDRATSWLLSQQDARTGGWSIPADPAAPTFPAITGLVLTGMLMDAGADASSEPILRGAGHMLSFRQPDGGIYDRLLPSYNTSICLSALALLRERAAGSAAGAQAASAVTPAQDFLRSIQWSEEVAFHDDAPPEAPARVTRDHPFYGGVGYGRHGRPDNSNLNLMLQGLHDSGVDGSDPAFQRALVFLSRTQMLDGVNDMPYADGSSQGGFIYSTSVNRDQVGVGQTMVAGDAALIEETTTTGATVSRLRAYGSMTYAGFKSMVYADLSRDDPRVRAAEGWIRRHYTLSENPGMGYDGFYYYLLTFARAMDARGEATITPIERGPDGTEHEGAARDWASDLVDRLAELQNEDGSFRSIDDRWMENNAVLITAYALIALQEAVD